MSYDRTDELADALDRAVNELTAAIRRLEGRVTILEDAVLGTTDE